MEKTIDQQAKSIDIQLKLNIYNEYSYDKDNIKFLTNLFTELGPQVGFNGRENLLILNKNLNTPSYSKDPQSHLDQFYLREQVDIYLNQYFTIKLIIKNILDQEIFISNQLIKVKNKIKNSLKKDEKVVVLADEQLDFKKSSLMYQSTQIKINLENKEKLLKREKKLIPTLEKKLSKLRRFIYLNYHINLDELKSETLFSLNSLVKKGLFEANSVTIYTYEKDENIIDKSAEHLIFCVNDKLLSLSQLFDLMKTKQLFLQSEYLESKTLAAYFVLFNEFEKDKNIEFINNYNVFKGVFETQVKENQDRLNNYPLFEKIHGRLKEWDFLITQYNSCDNPLIASGMLMFLLKEFVFDINKLTAICSSFK